jgi:hypothetical protein
LKRVVRRERIENIEAPFAHDLVLAASSYVVAAFGLAGTLIGGAVAGTVTYMVARQAQEAAEKSWIRNTRREVYDRFLTRAQDLQVTCQLYKAGDPDDASRDAVERAFNDFFHVYAVIQTIAEPRVVAAARIHGYRLHELRDEALEKPGKLDPPNFVRVDELVRDARHDTVEAMSSGCPAPRVPQRTSTPLRVPTLRALTLRRGRTPDDARRLGWAAQSPTPESAPLHIPPSQLHPLVAQRATRARASLVGDEAGRIPWSPLVCDQC